MAQYACRPTVVSEVTEKKLKLSSTEYISGTRKRTIMTIRPAAA